MQRQLVMQTRNVKCSLSDNNNPRAKKIIEALMSSSGDAIQETNDYVTYDDLDFLRTFLGWIDVGEE
jgi:hypothetical protein